MKVAPTSTLDIDESPVTCGEPARRTDNIDNYHNTRARDGVWDKSVFVNSGSTVRLDLRDSGIVGVLESRVGESGFCRHWDMESGLNQSTDFLA